MIGETPVFGSGAFHGAVSIHASAREATNHGQHDRPVAKCFNPRLRAGGDNMSGGSWSSAHEFQSTPPRGERP